MFVLIIWFLLVLIPISFVWVTLARPHLDRSRALLVLSLCSTTRHFHCIHIYSLVNHTNFPGGLNLSNIKKWTKKTFKCSNSDFFTGSKTLKTFGTGLQIPKKTDLTGLSSDYTPRPQRPQYNLKHYFFLQMFSLNSVTKIFEMKRIIQNCNLLCKKARCYPGNRQDF